MKYIQTNDNRIYKVDTNLLKVADKFYFVAIEFIYEYHRVRPENAKREGLSVGSIHMWNSYKITELIDPDVVIEIFKNDQDLPLYDYKYK